MELTQPENRRLLDGTQVILSQVSTLRGYLVVPALPLIERALAKQLSRNWILQDIEKL